MRITDMNRNDLEADVVGAALAGDKIVVLADTREQVRPIFQTIADAFTGDDGKVMDGVTIRRQNGRERIELRKGARITFGSLRAPDSLRGLVADRIYTPADTKVEVLRILEAVTITSPKPATLLYGIQVDA
ncbi:hypothetical protein SEA_WHYTU_21 [Arthrobacter phage Whytu]|uniref:Replication-associated protein n=1 Tax=Arthrobacter phage Whytu TaxID=2713260 RepID=A0A6G8R2R5_9CAUD|nr:hypothetical protein QEX69_gp21 [Arthrobacter phage Whytu]QIN94490.1 hypothetical protein SEA_WHYTU_21 [Arthrobacter phage Whytu]